MITSSMTVTGPMVNQMVTSGNLNNQPIKINKKRLSVLAATTKEKSILRVPETRFLIIVGNCLHYNYLPGFFQLRGGVYWN